MTIRLFVSYCHKDEAFREQLAKHLSPLQREKDVEIWFDGDILEGDALSPEIRQALKRSDILVALASHHYLDSKYCFDKEYMPAIRRAAKGTIRVVAALVSACDWKNTKLANYKLMPKDGKPIDQWGNRNKAYLDIVAGIRRLVKVVRAEKKLAEAAEGPAKITVPKPGAPQKKPRPKAAPQMIEPADAARQPLVRRTKSKRPANPGKVVEAPAASPGKVQPRQPVPTRRRKKPA